MVVIMVVVLVAAAAVLLLVVFVVIVFVDVDENHENICTKYAFKMKKISDFLVSKHDYGTEGR
jgi:hypothetical protein